MSSRVFAWFLVVSAVTATSWAGLEPPFADPPQLPSLAELTAELPWRAIGPAAFGGRISDVEAHPSDPDTLFVAAASGGIFRSRNRGVTWSSVFDDIEGMLSVGDLAIAPSDPNLVWAGTGEPNNRQSSSWGAGVYRSLDGGDTWQLMGLKETRHIGRIVIHPTNPAIVYVAALGHLWGPNPERGLYRTRDGGRSWDRILEINSDTGVVDVALEGNGRVLYAAAYQRRRRAWGFVGGGPHSAVYRSLDGGDSWEELTQDLPTGDIGRIGLAIAPSLPNRVYAIVEHKEGGVFRSENRGASWEKVNSLNPRPMYYSQIRVDPHNPDKVWVLGSPLYLSIDGGKNFTSDETARDIHVDHHALWINPLDPDHLILGNDGGLYLSYDGSSNWDFIDNLPLAQYYAIGLDGRSPYWVYGGTQDNGTWALPSRTHGQLGITNADVVNIAYGDGFYAAVHPQDHTLVFTESQNGRLYFVDMSTLEERGIRPVPEQPEEEYRFNWSSPLAISAHDPEVLYYGGNKLFRSRDRGQSWEEVSPDLTGSPKWEELPVMGLERNDDTLSRDDGIAHFGTITTISESPLQPGLILVGSDDGRVQQSNDGGGGWTDLTSRFPLSEPRWVSRVVASTHDARRAYVSFDGHQDDDLTPYLFRSDDAGRSWSDLGATLPPETVVNCIAEHPNNPNLLFAGTEWGLFASWDAGSSWVWIKGNLPTVPIDDILVHARENDLILGTHGRGILILDDLAALEELGAAGPRNEPRLFPVRAALQFYERRALPVPGASEFAGPNPPYGALIDYYLPQDLAPTPEETGEQASGPGPGPEEETESTGGGGPGDKPPAEPLPPAKVTLEIRDAAGELVRELPGPGRAGLHRIAWDLRHPLSFEPVADDEGWFGPPRGPFALPGPYEVVLSVGDQTLRQSFQVVLDPAASTSDEQLAERLEASRQTDALLGVFVRAAKRTEDSLNELKRLAEQLEAESKHGDLLTELKATAQQLEETRKPLQGGWRSEKFRLLDLLGQLQASTKGPTRAQRRTLEQVTQTLRENIEKFNQLLADRLVPLREKLVAAGFPDVAGAPLDSPR